jgi:protein-S-isoprenylcysteine O-methyltransferase Ste14
MTTVDLASPFLMLAGSVLVVVGLVGASGRWRLFGKWSADSKLNRRAGIGVVVTGVGVLLHAIGRVLESGFGIVLLVVGAVLLLAGVAHGVFLIRKSELDRGE